MCQDLTSSPTDTSGTWHGEPAWQTHARAGTQPPSDLQRANQPFLQRLPGTSSEASRWRRARRRAGRQQACLLFPAPRIQSLEALGSKPPLTKLFSVLLVCQAKLASNLLCSKDDGEQMTLSLPPGVLGWTPGLCVCQAVPYQLSSSPAPRILSHLLMVSFLAWKMGCSCMCEPMCPSTGHPQWHLRLCLYSLLHSFIIRLTAEVIGQHADAHSLSFHCASPWDSEPFPAEPRHWLLALPF